MTRRSPFKYFKTSLEIIRLAVMLYVRFPPSLRNVEDLLHERGVDVSHETIRYWWHRFGPMFASEIRKRRIEGMRSGKWRWLLDETFAKINGEMHYLWRAVDHEGEVLESFVTKTRDRKAALEFLRKAMRKHCRPETIVTDKLRSYGAAPKELGAVSRQETGRSVNNRAENSHLPFRRRAGHAPVSAEAEFADVRRHPRFCLEPLQLGTQPLHTRPVQAEPHRRSRRVAWCLQGTALLSIHGRVRIRVTAPGKGPKPLPRSGRRDQDDLADVPLFLKDALRLGDLVERVGGRQQGADIALLDV